MFVIPKHKNMDKLKIYANFYCLNFYTITFWQTSM